jgi:NAD(P)-dependent dehydrogenase (short-subunit alcohol dehydrogenase family)
MASQQSPDPEMFTKKFQFTPTFYHDIYPSIDHTNPDLSQSGRVILVTGAGRGIGKAVVLYFAKVGAKGIVICSRTESELEETRNEIGKVDREVEVVAVKADVSREDDVKRVFEKSKEAGMRIDMLVSNAGPGASTDKLADSDTDKWWYYFVSYLPKMPENLQGQREQRTEQESYTHRLFLSAKYFIKQLEGRVGTLVNVSAFVTLMPVAGRLNLSPAKGACNQIMEHIHEEEPNVRVFSMHPGVVLTSASSSKFAFLAKDNGKSTLTLFDIEHHVNE